MNLGDWLEQLTDNLYHHRPDSECSAQAPISCAGDRSAAALEARLIVARCMDMPSESVLARGDIVPSPAQSAQIERWQRFRLQGHPMAYLLAEAEFFSLRFELNPYVLIPRPETELLVEQALSLFADSQSRARLLELGTGSGCVAISIAHQRAHWRLDATDRYRSILDVARANAKRLGVGNIRWLLSSWMDEIDDQYDIIVSNPPYIGADLDTLNALRYEPLDALYGGPDGLEAITELIRLAPDYLRPGGWLLLEIGADQKELVEQLAHKYRYQEIEVLDDLAGHPRLLRARYQNPVRPG